MTTYLPARRVPSMEDIERPGDYSGPTTELNAKGEPIGRSVWFLLPTADPASPYGHGEYDSSAAPEVNRATWLAHRHNGLHRVTEPPWVFRECADGSLEIRASIASGRGDPEGEYFHGYLDEGNRWRIL